jgi:hypothetical protein
MMSSSIVRRDQALVDGTRGAAAFSDRPHDERGSTARPDLGLQLLEAVDDGDKLAALEERAA